MNAERTIARACRIYGAALLLYPRNHRAEYGREMEQLFRDQCRAAVREAGARGLGWLGLRTLGDLFLSGFREHLSQQIHQMKTMSPSKISLILFIAALAFLQFAANSATNDPALTVAWLIFSALALLGRAVAEGFRQPSEWLRGIIWGIGIAFLYALIFPAARKFSDNLGLAAFEWIKLSGVGVLLNFAVPIVKALLLLVRRRAA
jgi:hypothetical protein